MTIRRNKTKLNKQDISKKRRKNFTSNNDLKFSEALTSKITENKLEKAIMKNLGIKSKISIDELFNSKLKKFNALNNDIRNKGRNKEPILSQLKDSKSVSKINKFEKSKLEDLHSDRMFYNTMQEWGKRKAKKDEQIINKIDQKGVMKRVGTQQAQKFIKQLKNLTKYIDLRPLNILNTVRNEIDSDTSLSELEQDPYSHYNEILEEKPKPKPTPNVFRHKPKIIDFSKSEKDLNANMLNDAGEPHFILRSSSDLLNKSPSKTQQSKLRDYFNDNLWTHMTDFSHDGKTKIQSIRRKYRHLVSPPAPKLNIDNLADRNFKKTEMILFAKRDHNDRFRYEQMKEINSLKDRLARDGIVMYTNVLKRAILMPEDIK